ncbi:hypothetical protein V5799_016952 [Amblyomma americanum]|uniref:eIF-4F 25 kDa subunit n=1 Tax=Amblyomma americanum TaxID=6943 RepID=A0AAQ4F3M8_AMBAM
MSLRFAHLRPCCRYLAVESVDNKPQSWRKTILKVATRRRAGEERLWPRRQQLPKSVNLKLVCTFDTVEQFWRHYSHLIRPSEMSGHSDYHLFKEGIKPMWEDEANRTGGKWIVRLRKGLASRCWENLILAILGEQFMVGEEVCGAVVSVRFQEDIVSIWNRTASDSQTTLRIRDTLRRVLNLPVNTVMEYKTHTDSLRHV